MHVAARTRQPEVIFIPSTFLHPVGVSPRQPVLLKAMLHACCREDTATGGGVSRHIFTPRWRVSTPTRFIESDVAVRTRQREKV